MHGVPDVAGVSAAANAYAGGSVISLVKLNENQTYANDAPPDKVMH